ncbi:delta-12 fatty acid desaturase protein [Amylocystis lapponica]|nr:delta-12 fatty acid desaturase protein [Amylocystis lapponica]
MHGPEYEDRCARPFSPPTVTFADVNLAVPRHLRRKSLVRGLFYVGRDAAFSYLFYVLAGHIDTAPFLQRIGYWALPVRTAMWMAYWFWQGVAWTGFWSLAHEAGHGNLSEHYQANYALGFILHTFLMIPHFSWRYTHYMHHKYANSLERDENFIPSTRSEYGLPLEGAATETDYDELFADAPFYTLLKMLRMQLIGMQAYLCLNAMGSKAYPPGTNHFSPSSPLFRPKDRHLIIATNIGLAVMATILVRWTWVVGVATFVKIYFVPYLLANHWIVMHTYLQHSDPTIPHYRTGEWTWVRGALSTVDRPLLGWVGRFFIHNLAHDHIAHHLFPMIPFYNQPQVTEVIKPVLKEHYNYDSTNTFYALYRTFTRCIFVEDEGGVLFYKDMKGNTARSIKAEHDKSL